MSTSSNAVWLYLGSEARNSDEIHELIGWCRRNRIGRIIVYLSLDDRRNERFAEQIDLLGEACARHQIELHGMVSTLIQRSKERDALWLKDKSYYCVDADGISTYDEPIAGNGYALDPRHPFVAQAVTEGIIALLRRFPALSGVHLDFIRYYHFDSSLEIDTKNAGHWIGVTKPGQTLRFETAEGVRTTFTVRQARQRYNDPPVGEKLLLTRTHRFCFCDGCLDAFERESGVTISSSLPHTAAKAEWLLREQGDAWAVFRSGIVSRLVRSIRKAISDACPGAQLSAAVWYNAPYGNELRDEPLTPGSVYQLFGQDWQQWIADGDLDFVCPMNYWLQPDSFADVVREQVNGIDGKIPLYAGLLTTGEFAIDGTGYEAYRNAAHAAGAAGLCFFHYGSWKEIL